MLSGIIDKLKSLNVKNIADYLFTEFRKDLEIKDTNLAGNINDILIKIGFIYFSRDMIKDIMENNLREHSDEILFFLSSLIYSSKAFLDSIAVLLNEFYNLKKSGGEIDLEKENFITELDNVSSIIVGSFKKKKLLNWIKNVKQWRDAYIHKMSIFVASYGHGPKAEPTEDEMGNEGLKMIKRPIASSKFIQLGCNYELGEKRMGATCKIFCHFVTNG